MADAEKTHVPAELHDIGKLLNWKDVGLQRETEPGHYESEPHDFEKCTGDESGINFSAAPWPVIHRKNASLRSRHWPDSLACVWASLGDGLAAGWGRGASENQFKGNPRYGRYCLWSGAEQDDPRLNDPGRLRDMIAFLNGNPTWEHAERKYGDLWFRRAETARPGLNVTTLHSHSVVAGKLARVLAGIADHPVQASWSWDQVEASLNRIHLIVAHFRIDAYQRPFRVSEWNIFAQRREALDRAEAAFPDNIIGRVSNQCIGIFASKDQADEFARAISNAGFSVLRRQVRKGVDEVLAYGIMGVLYPPKKGKKGAQKKKDGDDHKWEHLYSELPDRIELPICECCQMAHAEHHWPTERGEEDLCTRCFELRQNAESLRKLHSWGEGSVAWVHVRTDIEKLRETLEALHQDYVKEKHPTIDQKLLEKVEARYPLLVDFIDDYRKFLEEFHKRLEARFSPDGTEKVDENLWCIRLKSRADALHMIQLYNELMGEHFPKLIGTHTDLPCPIRFAMSVSPIKHPFFAHWRFLEEPSHDVSIQLVGSGVARVSIHALGDVLNALDHGKRRALHRLRDIARTSQMLAETVLRDREDRDRRAFEKVRQVVPHKVDFHSMVTLTNLGED